MAGDWIKMRTDLATDPAVIAIADATGLDEDTVVGKLHRLWSWADQQTEDGVARGNAKGNAKGNAASVTEKWVDRYLSVQGFAEAMALAGWLDIFDDGIAFPDFGKHNGQTGKRRALTAKRVALSKARKGNADGNADSVTGALPREEKSKSKNKPPLSPLDLIKYPPGFDRPDVRAAIEEWLAYKRGRGEGYKKPVDQITKLLNRFAREATPELFVDAVDHSSSQNYAGCFLPGDRPNGAQKPVSQRGRVRSGAYTPDMFAPHDEAEV